MGVYPEAGGLTKGQRSTDGNSPVLHWVPGTIYKHDESRDDQGKKDMIRSCSLLPKILFSATYYLSEYIGTEWDY